MVHATFKILGKKDRTRSSKKERGRVKRGEEKTVVSEE